MIKERWVAIVCAGLILLKGISLAEQRCTGSGRINGSVTDPTGAVIPGAEIRIANGPASVSDETGRYILPCISPGTITMSARAEGFSDKTLRVSTRAGQAIQLDFHLDIASVESEIQVGGDDSSDTGSRRGAGTIDLNTEQVSRLPDDPDDLLRQLQALASSSGGDPTSVTVYVDGFQSPSAMPPKSSIASIRVNPDFFAPQYQTPNWRGGQIEVTTKPGADRFYGAVFATNSNGIFNATNPFSTTATPAGRQRYGAELTGPIVAKKFDFNLALERRDIDEFNVVNARTFDANGNQTPVHQAVRAPQQLWIGSVRGDWQISKNDIATTSYSANINDQGNQGVGGLVLQEAGYASDTSEYDLRLTNALTLNENTLHETRVGYSWKRTRQTPNSTAPNLQVAGFFTGGGATSQNLNQRERDLEIDNDLIATRGKHEINLGMQSISAFIHYHTPNTFNGAYLFGGGIAPVLDENNHPTGETTTISGDKQYKRALAGFPGGAPTTYQLTSGNPLVAFTQLRFSWYVQDVIKLAPRLSITAGLRYQLETNPGSFGNLRPRLGILWSPAKKSTWTIGLRAGLFTGWQTPTAAAEVYRLNGIRQQQVTVYSPNYNDPLTPTRTSIAVSTRNQFARSYGQVPNLQLDARLAHEFAHHWTAQLEYGFGAEWSTPRIVNINAPLVSSSIGAAPDPLAALAAPRPIAPNENINDYRTYAHSRGAMYIASLKQNSYKRFSLNITGWYLDFMEDTAHPQTTYCERGESGRPGWMRRGGISVLGVLQLPYKVELDTQFSAMPGLPYNITTGTDVNGDGNVNDRPSYTSTTGAGVQSTLYGLMTVNTVNGNVPYNAGTMPGTMIQLDPNLRRTFVLNPNDKDHQKTLSFNARSSNVLNHTNVTAVNTVLSSGSIGQPVAANPARRFELAVRLEF